MMHDAFKQLNCHNEFGDATQKSNTIIKLGAYRWWSAPRGCLLLAGTSIVSTHEIHSSRDRICSPTVLKTNKYNCYILFFSDSGASVAGMSAKKRKGITK